ncbi:DUF3307 domain-containing protein [Pseudofrankia inefficax]|uniref:DUF3307 domain-containing protein n=1 Tax=Pseudofrankia inefficax (strain DSM 45817 / CECT 9037 / DDB 130130 / EuI1c) TaxID=298654 RepID=E3IX43_PSEI1|nr:DUF3307 domain-containing protein [Pseudofrankia inefficax]ADP83815.1 Protein of unknown function DUF3307 [Pseudofrankia inefficax]
MIATTFAALAASAYAAHQIADHLAQTDAMAATKAGPGRASWAALARHVGVYHLIVAAMCGIAIAVLGLSVSPAGAAVGLTVSAATHALWDRRTPVRWLLEHTGSRQWAATADRGIHGLYLSDQALHVGCLWLAVLLATVL